MLTVLLILLVLVGAPCGVRPRPPAETAYKNLQVLQNRPASEVEPLMKAMNRALGVECTHCHVQDRWDSDLKPPHAIARNMLRMVEFLNANQLSDVEGITCWTCHAGTTRPSRLPPDRMAAAEELWKQANPIGADGQRLTMAVYSASLGVGCDHCHVAGDWKAGAKPAYRIVSKMNAMFAEFPKFMPPTARTQCFMCHKGAATPKRTPDPARLLPIGAQNQPVFFQFVVAGEALLRSR